MRDASANILILEIRAFVEAHFLMDASATLLSLALTPLVLAVKHVRDASANILILEMRVFLQS